MLTSLDPAIGILLVCFALLCRWFALPAGRTVQILLLVAWKAAASDRGRGHGGDAGGRAVADRFVLRRAAGRGGRMPVDDCILRALLSSRPAARRLPATGDPRGHFGRLAASAPQHL